ncbi:MAG: MBL fold metallo-hydrolase, partial [Lachnospiraceae bacterium]|nr:MBL fold metallo-hydrolase [Lachnospiraceae bacterium]
MIGKERAIMIDSGMNTPNAKEIAESITKLPLTLLNTHVDMDHVSGNASFESVMMGEKEEALYRAKGGKNTVIPLKHGDVIDLGERPLKIIDLPGHTPGSIAILDEKYRVLFGGDSIQNGRIYMFGAHRNMELYIESMIEMKKYVGEFDEIYPSHSDLPLKPDCIPKLIEAAEQILAGQAEGTEVEVHGMPI